MITITIPVDEYISLRQRIGHQFAVISEETRVLLTSQPGWENDIFIQEIEDSPVFKLWRLKDWQWHRETCHSVEIKKEQNKEISEAAKAKFVKLEAWKRTCREKLRATGKCTPEKIEQLIRQAMDPKGSVKEKEFMRPNGEGIIELDKVAYQAQVDYNTRLQAKLNTPMDCI
jgi:hypothetical protein